MKTWSNFVDMIQLQKEKNAVLRSNYCMEEDVTITDMYSDLISMDTKELNINFYFKFSGNS